MRKILIITYYWPPCGGAGVQRWLKFTKYLPEFGIKPYILTVDVKYASYFQVDESLKKDIPPDITVFTTKSFEALNILSTLIGGKNVPYGGFTNVNKRSFLQYILRFIRGNFFIPDARVGWNGFAYRKAKDIIKKYKIDTIITTSPPHSTQLIGLKLKKKFNIPWIADFRDPWTDIYYYNDLLHTSIAKWIDKKKERNVLENADKIISNCNSNKDLLISKIGNEFENKFKSITNGFDEDEFNQNIINPDSFIITYTGTISGNYNPNSFFMVLSEVIQQFPEIKFKLKMVGNVSPEVERIIDEYDLNTIYDPVGYVNHSELILYLLSSTVLFYIFPETKYDKGIAGKLFEYLAAKKTIIGIGPKDGDSYKIIRKCNAGEMFSRQDTKELKDYFIKIVKLWKEKKDLNIKNNCYLKYSRRNVTKQLVEKIKEVG